MIRKPNIGTFDATINTAILTLEHGNCFFIPTHMEAHTVRRVQVGDLFMWLTKKQRSVRNETLFCSLLR